MVWGRLQSIGQRQTGLLTSVQFCHCYSAMVALALPSLAARLAQCHGDYMACELTDLQLMQLMHSVHGIDGINRLCAVHLSC
jgi:hypothetical protein